MLQAALQNFAWTERSRDQIRITRAVQCSTTMQREAAFAEPVFCFETACKALYWSILVYRIQARPVNQPPANAAHVVFLMYDVHFVDTMSTSPIDNYSSKDVHENCPQQYGSAAS